MALLTPALQTYSILAASFAAGANLSTSIITFPALLHAQPPTLTKQWHTLYTSGMLPVVTTALTASAGFATLAYRTTLSSTLSPVSIAAKRNFYIAAALTMLGLAPYTRLLMISNINELTKRAEAGDKDEKADTRDLVLKWGKHNLWRGAMLMTGTGLGIWASVI